MTWGLLLLIAATLIAWSVVNVVAASRWNSLRELCDESIETPSEQQPTASVAILCPARDEAAHLRETLRGLCEQDYDDYRVLLIDDNSRDETRAIADELAEAYHHLHVVSLQSDPPAGWVGKCWALHCGYRWLTGTADELDSSDVVDAGRSGSVEGRPAESDPVGNHGTADSGWTPPDWVCFTDADVHWKSTLLRSALPHAQTERAEVLSLFPGLIFGSAWEGIVQLQLMLAVAVLMPMDKAMDAHDPRAIAAGAFILVKRDWYEAIGGHRAVADKVVEDINLARQLKAHGARLRIAFARQQLYCRMYTGFADQWEGLTKNAFAGLDYRVWRAGLLTIGALLVNVLPPVYLLIAIGWAVAAPGPWSWSAVAGAAAANLLMVRALDKVRQLTDLPRCYSLTVPIGSALYIAILLTSAIRNYRGGNVWKGRAYRRSQRKAR